MSEPEKQSRPARFYASVRFDDTDAGIEWLEKTLGFDPIEIDRNDDGVITHAEFGFGESVFMVGTNGVGSEPFRSLPSAERLIYCAIDDVEALHDRAVAAGAEVAMPLTDTDYGSRDFTLRDPEGNLWSFGTYRPEYDGGSS